MCGSTGLAYLAHMHSWNFYSVVPLYSAFSSVPYNSLSVSMMVMSMVSRRISPNCGVNGGINLRRTVSFGFRAMLSLVKVMLTIAGVVCVTRIDVGAS